MPARPSSLCLLILALGLADPARAAEDPRAAGLELGLAASPTQVVESSRGGGWGFSLSLRNASPRTRCLALPSVLFGHQVRWEITDARGGKWRPTFLPPPTPRSGWPPPPRRRCLRPGAQVVLAGLGGISGFERAGPATRWYLQPPGGTYRVRVVDLKLQGIRLDSSAATVRVLPADAPVGGLRLALAAAPARTVMLPDGRNAAPVKLRLTFTNSGKTPLALDLHDLAYSKLTLHVDGPSHSSSEVKREAAPAASRQKQRARLAPGQRLVPADALPFPGQLGRRKIWLTAPGWFRLRVVYASKAQGAWSGEVSSNMLWLEVRPTGKQP